MAVIHSPFSRPEDDDGMDPVRRCTLYIEGMTCQSCVRQIESAVGAKPGIVTAKVNLEEKRGLFDYDPSIAAPDIVREYVSDLGFEASFQMPEETKEASRCVIYIEGMSCQKCVRNIEGTMGGVDGVQSIKVSLDDKKAVIRYDPGLLSPEALAEKITGIATKFKASVFPQTVIGVEGMTCQSCVKNIEGTIGARRGVKLVKVSLEDKEARVGFDPELTSPNEICDAIFDMGFNTKLKTASEAKSTAPPSAADKVDERTVQIEEEDGNGGGRIDLRINGALLSQGAFFWCFQLLQCCYPDDNSLGGTTSRGGMRIAAS